MLLHRELLSQNNIYGSRLPTPASPFITRAVADPVHTSCAALIAVIHKRRKSMFSLTILVTVLVRFHYLLAVLNKRCLANRSNLLANFTYVYDVDADDP